jgi:hypothetical protein
MKIGLSFSRCLRDIVDGKVDIDDVMVIIARTDFDPRVDVEWKDIWEGYSGVGSFATALEWVDYGSEYEDIFRKIAIDLYETGKLHQPRQYGARPIRYSHYWLETIVCDQEHENNPALKTLWDQYQMMAGLVKPITNDFF